MADSEDEREMHYTRPTMVEKIGPEEARRLLMDDDDLSTIDLSKRDDDEKSVASQQPSV